jgi:hypothetical protein
MSRTFLRESILFQLKPNAAQSRGGLAVLIVDDVGVVEDAAESRLPSLRQRATFLESPHKLLQCGISAGGLIIGT